MHLITGYKGAAHVTASDQASYNAALWGNGQFVLERGNQFSYQVISNTKVKIKDGDIICQGRHIRLTDAEDLTIDTGAVDATRCDLLVVEYEKTAGSGIEAATLKVIKGANNGGDPSLVTGDTLSGDLIHQMPLYRVRMRGINLEGVDKLFDTVETLETIKANTVASVQQKTQQLISETQSQVANIAADAAPQINSNTNEINEIKNGTQAVGNSDKLGGHNASYFATASELSGKLNANAYTANDVLNKLKTVDGNGSGLDADMLDGNHASHFATAAAVNNIVSGATKAGDANKLGGHNPDYFAVIQKHNLTISNSGWGDSGDSQYSKRKAVTLSGVTTSDIVDVNIHRTSYAVAQDAGLASFTETYNGGFYLYAENAPDGSITATVKVVK